jgi:hypothetical protein
MGENGRPEAILRLIELDQERCPGSRRSSEGGAKSREARSVAVSLQERVRGKGIREPRVLGYIPRASLVVCRKARILDLRRKRDAKLSEGAVGSSSWLDLGVVGRTILAAVYLLVQVALLITASARPDGVFAFRMFNESSTISIELLRRVELGDGSLAVVPTNGAWKARDTNGVVHDVSWNDRVRDPILGTLGRPVHAAYGVDAQLFRLQRALDDVARSTTQDGETKALLARVAVVRNGHQRYETLLESARP